MSGRNWKQFRNAGLCGKCGLFPPVDKKSMCLNCSNAEKLRLREYKSRNREKLREDYTKYIRENRQKENARKRKWAKQNPEKVIAARKRGHYRRDMLERFTEKEFTAEEWKQCLDSYGGRCLWCGTTERITIDHVVPLSKGGSNRLENLQPLCVSCNSKKRTKTMDFRRVWAI